LMLVKPLPTQVPRSEERHLRRPGDGAFLFVLA
jgi:hypothetical protein